MTDKLTDFTEKIMRISPSYIDVFGRGMPGMGGASEAIPGASNTGSSALSELQQSAIELTRLYRLPTTTADELQVVLKRVEAGLMTVQTLSGLTAKETDTLINELYDLIENRK